MTKEGELKKTELKVSVHCCDGCKKKVQKALRSIEGVFKTEIDSLEPKVTVQGNVEPQALIKKLLKVGKQAELWSYENQNARKENNETASPNIKSDKESSTTSGRQQTKTSETRNTQKLAETAPTKEEVANKAAKKDEDSTMKIENSISAHHSEPKCIVHPSIDSSKVETETQYYYMVEPRPVMVPYYAIYPYNTPPLATTHTRGHEMYNCVGMTCQPPVQAPSTPVGDYFSDENTVGCQVM